MHKAVLSLTFDDGLRCQFEHALPVLNKYDFRATFFLIANTDANIEQPTWYKIDWSTADTKILKDVINRGHEIGAHSVTHNRSELDSNPKFEAKKSKEWIESRLGVEIPSYCYPYCHVTPPIKNAVIDAGYKQARGGDKATFIDFSGADQFNLDCRKIKDNEDVKAWIKPGYWHVLMYHGIGTAKDGWEAISTSDFIRQMAELAQFRDSGAVEVVPFKDGLGRVAAL